MDSAFSLSEIPPKIRYSLYEENFHLSSLYSLCNVSRQFRNEITEFIFEPTLKAKNFCIDPFRHLDSLIAHTQIYGKRIKWLNLNLCTFFHDEKLIASISESLDTTEDKTKLPLFYSKKIISVLQSCPNLSSLYLKYGVDIVDNDYLIKEINDKFFPQASLLENLRFLDFSSIDLDGFFKKFGLNNLGLLINNLGLLNRFQKISINAIDFDINTLSQFIKLIKI